MKKDRHEIEIAVDTTEAQAFCNWLNEHGHRATIGHTTGNYVDGVWTSDDNDANDTMNRLWDKYCGS